MAAAAATKANTPAKTAVLFQRGATGFAVPAALHAQNRLRAARELRRHVQKKTSKKGGTAALLLRGGRAQERNDSDHEPVFRQESYFQHLFGVREPGCWGAVVFPLAHGEETESESQAQGQASLGALGGEIVEGEGEGEPQQQHKSVLFVPRLPEAYAVWMGRIEPPSEFRARYGVDDCFLVDEMYAKLRGELGVQSLFLLEGPNSDSGAACEAPACPTDDGSGGGGDGRGNADADKLGWSGFETVDTSALFPVLQELRVIKTDLELDVLRYVNRVSSRAHEAVMRRVAVSGGGGNLPPSAHLRDDDLITHEHQIEALFQYESYFRGGCRHSSYTCICASGENGAVLHYGHAGAPNEREIGPADMVLLDMGAEYHCYTSDITRSYPVSGVFSANQRLIYETVLAAQDAVMQAMRPGVFWDDMHRLANRTICERLLDGGILQLPPGVAREAASDEMEALNLGAVFQPHGLGHFMGLDTHDVGGYPASDVDGGVVPAEDVRSRSDLAGLKSLRTSRRLHKNMVLTVEPGVYFIQTLLDQARAHPEQSRWINWARVKDFENFGGVRIEDDVIVTQDGCENMTTAPRTVDGIERLMREARETSAQS